jgi:hypothetical protein
VQSLSRRLAWYSPEEELFAIGAEDIAERMLHQVREEHLVNHLQQLLEAQKTVAPTLAGLFTNT